MQLYSSKRGEAQASAGRHQFEQEVRKAIASASLKDTPRLVDPRSRTMEVYRSGVEKEVLRDGDVLTVPELLPGWELAVAEIWAPEFD